MPFETNLNYVWCQFKIFEAGTVSSNGAIWEEFHEQDQHQSIKKASYLMPNQHFFIQISCRFYAHFS